MGEQTEILATYQEIVEIQWRIVGVSDALTASAVVWRERREAGDVAGVEAVTELDMRLYQLLQRLRERIAELQGRVGDLTGAERCAP